MLPKIGQYNPIFFPILMLIGLWSLNWIYVSIFTSAEIASEVSASSDGVEALSALTLAQLHDIQMSLWDHHCSLKKEIFYLSADLEKDLLVRDFKWKGDAIVLTVRAKKNLAYQDLEEIWPCRSIEIKKMEAKRAYISMQIGFALPRYRGMVHTTFVPFKDHAIFQEVADSQGIGLEECSYLQPPKTLQTVCDKVGRISMRGTLDQQKELINALEKQGWILGRTGRLYAKANDLFFDFELVHFSRAFDSSDWSTK